MPQREVPDDLDRWLREQHHKMLPYDLGLGDAINRYIQANPPPIEPPCWVTWGTGENVWLCLEVHPGVPSWLGVHEAFNPKLRVHGIGVDDLRRAERPEWADHYTTADAWWRPLVDRPGLQP